MKKIVVLVGIFLCICLASCANDTGNISSPKGENQMYEQITPQKAKVNMHNRIPCFIRSILYPHFLFYLKYGRYFLFYALFSLSIRICFSTAIS